MKYRAISREFTLEKISYQISLGQVASAENYPTIRSYCNRFPLIPESISSNPYFGLSYYELLFFAGPVSMRKFQSLSLAEKSCFSVVEVVISFGNH